MFVRDPTNGFSQITVEIDGPKYQTENKGKVQTFIRAKLLWKDHFLVWTKGEENRSADL